MVCTFYCFQNKRASENHESIFLPPPLPERKWSRPGTSRPSESISSAQAQFKSHGGCVFVAVLGCTGGDWNFSLGVRTRNSPGGCWAQRTCPGGGCRAFPSECIRPKSSSKLLVGSVRSLPLEVGAFINYYSRNVLRPVYLLSPGLSGARPAGTRSSENVLGWRALLRVGGAANAFAQPRGIPRGSVTLRQSSRYLTSVCEVTVMSLKRLVKHIISLLSIKRLSFTTQFRFCFWDKYSLLDQCISPLIFIDFSVFARQSARR